MQSDQCAGEIADVHGAIGGCHWIRTRRNPTEVNDCGWSRRGLGVYPRKPRVAGAPVRCGPGSVTETCVFQYQKDNKGGFGYRNPFNVHVPSPSYLPEGIYASTASTQKFEVSNE